jgi:hypothetical protein
MDEKDTFKYHLKQGRKIIHRGITDNILRTEEKHQRENSNYKVFQVGRRTTRDAALKWKHGGGKRRYQKNDW